MRTYCEECGEPGRYMVDGRCTNCGHGDLVKALRKAEAAGNYVLANAIENELDIINDVWPDEGEDDA